MNLPLAIICDKSKRSLDNIVKLLGDLYEGSTEDIQTDQKGYIN